MRLVNRTVLITGGSGGIGLELAGQLLRRGNTVLITGRDQGRLDAALAAFPGLHGFQSDVSDPAAIQALHHRVTAEFPTLDVLVNNAGVMRNLDFSRAGELTDPTREIEINLNGPIRMAGQFLPHLLRRGEAAIVNVSSALAFVPLPLSPVYSATKAALHSFSQSLRAQLAGTGVTVIELAPPGVETPLYRGAFAGTAAPRGMDAAVLARQAIAGIEAGRTEIRPGLSNLLQLMSRIAPGFALAQMVRASRRTR